jgi:ketosteroid isomerase-like protein
VSAANVEFVRNLYADPRGLSGAAADVVSPDAEFDFSGVYFDQPVLKGIEALRHFRESGPWSGSPIHFEPERFFDVDDERVLVFVRVSATGDKSGVPVDIRVAHELTIRDERLTRFKVYGDREEALAALGLSA